MPPKCDKGKQRLQSGGLLSCFSLIYLVLIQGERSQEPQRNCLFVSVLQSHGFIFSEMYPQGFIEQKYLYSGSSGFFFFLKRSKTFFILIGNFIISGTVGNADCPSMILSCVDLLTMPWLYFLLVKYFSIRSSTRELNDRFSNFACSFASLRTVLSIVIDVLIFFIVVNLFCKYNITD